MPVLNDHRCPVCGYDKDAEFYPRDYMICGCCGTEFGHDTRTMSLMDLRHLWIRRGCPWFDPDEPKPYHWNPLTQMVAAGFPDALPLVVTPSHAASDQPAIKGNYGAFAFDVAVATAA